ncbi:hypothetical protein QQG55_38985 [Brugia pahangi]|uniref:Uncharacterized protein n=1 Tax=Brugia pahangi TaxID=6280 RepID=A0A0N4SYA4_BRUPA|nr:unnamed protein product [Brugia pahangi]
MDERDVTVLISGEFEITNKINDGEAYHRTLFKIARVAEGKQEKRRRKESKVEWRVKGHLFAYCALNASPDFHLTEILDFFK